MQIHPDFNTMNETDVREVIVRPLLHRLGFAHNTEANIRTEVPLRYERAYLGRKKPKKDPPLAGRADYVCDAVSYGRWVVEVKAPHIELTRDDAEQAHTYCAHPEISASHFLLTNGREFRLFAVGHLESPLMQWSFSETDEKILTLVNIIGYEAMKKRAAILKPDVNKPLGFGLPSRLKVVGGQVEYEEHQSDHPLFAAESMNGFVSLITGGSVERIKDGRIRAVLNIKSPNPQFEAIFKEMGFGEYSFFTSDQHISSNIEKPTVFQNIGKGRLEPGRKFSLMPGGPEFPFPAGVDFTIYTEVAVYADDGILQGLMTTDQRCTVLRGPPTGIDVIDQLVEGQPDNARIEGVGKFKIIVMPT